MNRLLLLVLMGVVMVGCAKQVVSEKAFIDAVGKRHCLITVQPIWLSKGEYLDGQIEYYDSWEQLYKTLKKNGGD